MFGQTLRLHGTLTPRMGRSNRLVLSVGTGNASTAHTKRSQPEKQAISTLPRGPDAAIQINAFGRTWPIRRATSFNVTSDTQSLGTQWPFHTRQANAELPIKRQPKPHGSASGLANVKLPITALLPISTRQIYYCSRNSADMSKRRKVV